MCKPWPVACGRKAIRSRDQPGVVRAPRQHGLQEATHRGRVLRRAAPLFLVLLPAVFLPALTACGPTLYTVEIASAERAFEEARTESAKTYAPYEYHYAEAHLQQARREAAEASYEDAIRYAEVAERYSKRARLIASQRRAEAP